MIQTETSLATIEPTLLRSIWRYRWLVLVITTLSIAGAYYYSTAGAVTEFQAEASMQVQDPQATILFDSSVRTRRSEYVADQAEILRSDEVARRATEIAQKTDPSFPFPTEDVRARTRIILPSGSGSVILVRFFAQRPEWATLGANSLIEAYKSVLKSETTAAFESRIAVLDSEIEDLEKEVADLAQSIDTAMTPSATTTKLRDQLDSLRERLLELIAQQPAADAARLVEIRAELNDINREVGLLETFLALETNSPVVDELTQRRDQSLRQIASLTERRQTIAVDSQLLSSGVDLTNLASTALPLESDVKRYIVVGAFLGLLLSSGLAYALALRRRTITDRTLPELVLGSPLIASVPNFRQEGLRTVLPVRNAPRTAAAESFRFAAAALGLARPGSRGDGEGSGQTVMVASAGPADGKTVVAVNTALAAAREGKRVLLIDADFGNQIATELLAPDVKPNLGITEVVEVGASLTDAIIPIEGTDSTGLHLLARGWRHTTAPEFFRLPATREFVNKIKDYYDLVLIDAPPMLQVAYTSTIAAMVERLLVVVRHESSANSLEELRDRLTFIGTPLIGYIYNLAPLRFDVNRSEGSMKDILGTPEPEPEPEDPA